MMTELTAPRRPRWAALRHRRWIMTTFMGLMCVLSLGLGYMISAFRLRPADAGPRSQGDVEIYPNVLAINDEPKLEADASGSDDALIDKMIVERYLAGSHIRQLSRGRIYYHLPLRDAASVKIYLHTANPDQPEHDSRLNALLGLERRAGVWTVIKEETIHIE